MALLIIYKFVKFMQVVSKKWFERATFEKVIFINSSYYAIIDDIENFI
jgi:hypothetical protein